MLREEAEQLRDMSYVEEGGDRKHVRIWKNWEPDERIIVLVAMLLALPKDS